MEVSETQRAAWPKAVRIQHPGGYERTCAVVEIGPGPPEDLEVCRACARAQGIKVAGGRRAMGGTVPTNDKLGCSMNDARRESAGRGRK